MSAASDDEEAGVSEQQQQQLQQQQQQQQKKVTEVPNGSVGHPLPVVLPTVPLSPTKAESATTTLPTTMPPLPVPPPPPPPPPKPPAPRRSAITPYILFSSEVRRSVAAANRQCTFGQISRLVGDKVIEDPFRCSTNTSSSSPLSLLPPPFLSPLHHILYLPSSCATNSPRVCSFGWLISPSVLASSASVQEVPSPERLPGLLLPRLGQGQVGDGGGQLCRDQQGDRKPGASALSLQLV